MINQKFNFKGFRTSFPIGTEGRNLLSITLTNDDGTWGNYLVFTLDDVPYATLPVIDRDGLRRVINALENIEKNAFKE